MMTSLVLCLAVQAGEMRQYPLDLTGEPDFSRDRFVEGDSNLEARTALENWQNWQGGILALIGPKGSGKTHIGHIWAEKTNAIKIDGAKGFLPRKNYRASTIWVDNASQSDEYSLFALINLALTSEIEGLLITDRIMPVQWNVQLADLQSRLQNITTSQLYEADDEVLYGVLQKLFRDHNLKVADNTINYLLVHADRSIDSLKKLIAKIDRQAVIQKAEVTRSFVSNYLKNINNM